MPTNSSAPVTGIPHGAGWNPTSLNAASRVPLARQSSTQSSTASRKQRSASSRLRPYDHTLSFGQPAAHRRPWRRTTPRRFTVIITDSVIAVPSSPRLTIISSHLFARSRCPSGAEGGAQVGRQCGTGLKRGGHVEMVDGPAAEALRAVAEVAAAMHS
jgi:hypothetical protein